MSQQLKEVVIKSVDHTELSLYHSQPKARGYSAIVQAKRSVTPSAIQLAFVNAVVKEGVQHGNKA